jgi:hypothetical protein
VLGVAKPQALCLEFIESRGGLAKAGIASEDTGKHKEYGGARVKR